MSSMYFVITNSEGDTHVRALRKAELMEKINENYWGHREYIHELPKDSDTNYWGDGVLIIQGAIIKPRAKETVIEYEID